MVLKSKALFLTLLFFVCSAVTIYAHEVFYNPATSSSVALRWQDKTTSYLNVPTNGDYLNSTYTSVYSNAVSAWNGSPYVKASSTGFGSSKVDFATPTTNFWQQTFPNYSDYITILGITFIYDTNSAQISTYSTAFNSTRKIKSAQIYITPLSNNQTATQRTQTLTHEMGHAIGLGHSDNSSYAPIASSTQSIMRTSGPLNYYTPQTHENNDLKAMYGF